MDKARALEILGFAPDSDPDEKEIKKAFKKKAVKLHPDVNKSDNAEDEFKELNAAQDCLLNPEPEQVQGFPFSGYPGGAGPFADWFNMGPQIRFSTPPLRKVVNLSFIEAVLGSRQTIRIDKQSRCEECMCSTCNGAGTVEQTRQRENFVFSQRFPCPKCKGEGRRSDNCKACLGRGTVQKTSEFSVRIPGGVTNGNTIRLKGFGNVENHNGQLYAGDIILAFNVEHDRDMRIQGVNVISSIDISLLEALKGAKKKVRTVLGDINLTINKNTKHKDTLVVKGYGVEKRGDHHFVVNLMYPKDTDKVIKALEGE